MNLFGSLIEKAKFCFSFIFKGNKKTNQKDASSPLNIDGRGNTGISVGSLTVLNVSDVKELAGDQSVTSLQEVLSDAGKLFVAERVIKKQNYNEVVAAAKLDEIEETSELEKGWFVRWLEIAESTSNKDMQELIAKILRGEFQKVGTFAPRTLGLIQNLSQKELRIFQDFCNIKMNSLYFGNGDSVIVDPFGGGSNNELQSLGLSYANLTILQTAGLIHSEISLGANRTVQTPRIFLRPFSIGSIPFTLQQTKEIEDIETKIKIVRLTDAGRELSTVMPSGSNNEYNSKFLEWVSNKWGFVPIKSD